MCGIAGILQLDPAKQTPDARLLDAMLRAIVHRGPDDDGRLVDGPLAMGMRRLSIIDLSDGKQPIFDEARRFGVVFNGEIYNYRELRTTLESGGHTFRTQSDTEVIVHLYEQFGERCVDHLRGMFAFAVWDNKKRELFIARDRLGIKPLYFAEVGGQLIFASEIKAILEHPEYQPALDHRSLSQYLSLKFVPAPRTMFAGISSLLPGHCLRIRNGRKEMRRYWDVSFQHNDDAEISRLGKSEAQLEEELMNLLEESIRLRLRSDVPFGAMLSGGVDSSIIVALMSRMLNEPVKTFSVGFSDRDGVDELPYARQVATQFGCDHHEIEINGDHFLQHAEEVLFHLDQPIADHATVATHMVSRLARQHVKMVLTGEGGDELFAGYARYSVERLAPWMRLMPEWAGGLMRSAFAKLPGMRRQKIAMNALTIKDDARRIANWFPMLADDLKAELLSDSMHEHRAGAAALFTECLQNCDASDSLNRMLYADSKMWLPDYLLLRGDKLTMANSLEARVPLLDHKLVEFAARLPPNLKLRMRTRKYLLKKCASRLLPSNIVHRKKAGFPIPIDRWLNESANTLMRDTLSEDAVAARGLFNPAVVSRLIDQHERGFADNATELWGLVSFEMWMRQFIDSPNRSGQSVGDVCRTGAQSDRNASIDDATDAGSDCVVEAIR